jgi:hypothetical protein
MPIIDFWFMASFDLQIIKLRWNKQEQLFGSHLSIGQDRLLVFKLIVSHKLNTLNWYLLYQSNINTDGLNWVWKSIEIKINGEFQAI